MFKVILREYEKWWWSKDFETLEFDTIGLAKAKVNEINSKNNEAITPDYYITARLES